MSGSLGALSSVASQLGVPALSAVAVELGERIGAILRRPADVERDSRAPW